LSGTVLLHGDASLCATYLAAAGLRCLKVTGAPPKLAAKDPAFRLEQAVPGAAADVVLDLDDGKAWRAADGPRLWGAAHGKVVLLGCEPCDGPAPTGAARAVLETLAAGEALRVLMGHAPHVYRSRTGP